MNDKSNWLLLDKNIKEVNEGLSLDGAEVGYTLMDNRLIKVSRGNTELESWVMIVYDLTFLFKNWNKLIQKFVEDGGYEEYGSFGGWGGSVDWIETNCNRIGSSSV